LRGARIAARITRHLSVMLRSGASGCGYQRLAQSRRAVCDGATRGRD
jgi:hypothetical protein